MNYTIRRNIKGEPRGIEFDDTETANIFLAAPDMYEALQGIIAKRMENHDTEAAYIPSEIGAVYKALAKANGKS